MKRLMKLMEKDERGFTLMELMIVLIIIGILAAIAVPRLTSSAGKAKEIACEANARTLQNAIELYYVENEEYPPAAGDVTALQKYVSGGLPTCPSGGNYSLVLDETANADEYVGTNPPVVIRCDIHGTWDGSGLSESSPAGGS